jgi:hypothetical protein
MKWTATVSRRSSSPWLLPSLQSVPLLACQSVTRAQLLPPAKSATAWDGRTAHPEPVRATHQLMIKKAAVMDIALSRVHEAKALEHTETCDELITAAATNRVHSALYPAQTPATVSDFTGRESEAAALRRMLTRDGGQKFADRCGKDRQLPARELIRDAGSAPRAICGSDFGHIVHSQSMLARKRLMLVLDDASDAAHVRPFIAGATQCAFPITGRNRLVNLERARPLCPGALLRADARTLCPRIAGHGRLMAEPRR